MSERIDELTFMLHQATNLSEAREIYREIELTQSREVQAANERRNQSDPTGRRADHEDIAAAYNASSDPRERAVLREKNRIIASESNQVKAMRTQLIKANRNGDMDEVRNISEAALKDPRYRQ
jgi:hypothetical protein